MASSAGVKEYQISAQSPRCYVFLFCILFFSLEFLFNQLEALRHLPYFSIISFTVIIFFSYFLAHKACTTKGKVIVTDRGLRYVWDDSKWKLFKSYKPLQISWENITHFERYYFRGQDYFRIHSSDGSSFTIYKIVNVFIKDDFKKLSVDFPQLFQQNICNFDAKHDITGLKRSNVFSEKWFQVILYISILIYLFVCTLFLADYWPDINLLGLLSTGLILVLFLLMSFRK